MLSLRRPPVDAIYGFLESQARLDLTYLAIGATAAHPPPGYTVDHTRIELGKGETVFNSAKAALQRWEQFRLGWIEAVSPDTPIQTGKVVGLLAHAFGFWWLNACRIVNLVDESGLTTRYGYACGTLPDHAGTGEERFLIAWDHADNSVWYDILAFSKPRHFLVRLGNPLFCRAQKRFGRESAAAMLRVVGRDAPLTEGASKVWGDVN